MRGQVETFIWMMLGLLPTMGLAFWLVSTALRWKKQRNDAWFEWGFTLSVLDKADIKGFDKGVSSLDEQDKETAFMWTLIEDSMLKYERVTSKRFFFRNRATTSRFEEKSV